MRARRLFVRQALLLLSLLAGIVSSSRAAEQALSERFSGERALRDVQKLVELGPRPAGSDALEKARAYIEGELRGAGWKVERQSFIADTPRGAVSFVNLIATFGDQAAPEVLLCSHYDTKTFDTFRFVGANDGGSSTGLLI